MVKRDTENMIFKAGTNISIGEGYIDDDGWLYFKPLGSFRNPKKTFKVPKEAYKYIRGEFNFYDPHSQSKDYSEKWNVYYFDLENFQRFNFGESVPEHVVSENSMLKSMNDKLAGDVEELLRLLNASSMDDARKRIFAKDAKFYRDIFNHHNSGMAMAGNMQKPGDK